MSEVPADFEEEAKSSIDWCAKNGLSTALMHFAALP